MKKIWKFLSSMPFAVTLLVLLAAACAISSAVPQGETYENYIAQYGERTAGLIMALRLDDAFHSWWFIGLSAVLCLNLLCCNLIRLPALIKRYRDFAAPDKAAEAGEEPIAAGDGDPRLLFSAMRMRGRAEKRTADGRELLFAAGNRIGFWGAWVCHLGILMLILGFALGQATMKQYTVYALPGQTKEMGDTGLYVTVEDMTISREESGAISQYTATLSVSDLSGERHENGTASVNAPATLFGYKFFQNSVGWGADVQVLKNGKELQQEALCAGEFFAIADKPELVVYFPVFYPDYSGMPGQNDPSIPVKDPAYLYQVYYQGQILGMNALRAGEELTIDEYTVLFGPPRTYTLLAVKRDSYTWLVLLGGLITLAGLVLAFWVQPRSVWTIREDAGWTVYGRCRKGGVLFRDELKRAAEGAGFRICDREDSPACTEKKTAEGKDY